MKRLHVKFIKWLSNKFGYKIVMLKGKNGTTTIEERGVTLCGYIRTLLQKRTT